MARWFNNWQGIAPGGLSVGNSGDGGWDPLLAVTSGHFTVSTDAALSDPPLPQGLVHNPAASQVREARISLGSASRVFVVAYFRRTQTPTNGHTILQVRHGSGVAGGLYMGTANGGRMEVVAAGGNNWVFAHSSGALTANQWYRAELRLIPGETTSDGTISFQLFPADSTTPVATYSASDVNAGTTELAEVRFGRPSAATADVTVEHWGPISIWTDADDPGGHGYTYAEPVPPPIHQGHVWDGEEWRGIQFSVWDGDAWVGL